ncbi:MAG: hypothetical protein ABJF50_19330 [Paracoccaceae bacterium]
MSKGHSIFGFVCGVFAFAALPAQAVTLAECDRTIYISHGGESDHRDLGAGRVEYVEWWSQEGVFNDIVLANCESGTFLRTRVREARISDRAPFDVSKKTRKLIDVELTASPALFSFERLADALKGTGRDIEIAQLDAEPCACAAQYPALRGSKTPFEDIQ